MQAIKEIQAVFRSILVTLKHITVCRHGREKLNNIILSSGKGSFDSNYQRADQREWSPLGSVMCFTYFFVCIIFTARFCIF